MRITIRILKGGCYHKMMLKELLEKYDDHPGDKLTIFSDEKLPIFQDWLVHDFIEMYYHAPIMSYEVLFFGFYEGKFYIRIKEN